MIPKVFGDIIQSENLNYCITNNHFTATPMPLFIQDYLLNQNIQNNLLLWYSFGNYWFIYIIQGVLFHFCRCVEYIKNIFMAQMSLWLSYQPIKLYKNEMRHPIGYRIRETKYLFYKILSNFILDTYSKKLEKIYEIRNLYYNL